MPTSNQVTASVPLTNISVAYAQDQNNFVAEKMFPTVPVNVQTGQYWTYTAADMHRSQMQKRADGAPSVQGDYGLSTSTYFAEVYAENVSIGAQARANAVSPLDMDRDAALYLTNQALLHKEIQFANTFLTTGVWGTDKTPGTLWSAGGSTPINDIRTGMQTVLKNTGQRANKIVCSIDVFNTLIDHSTIVGRILNTDINAMAQVSVPVLANFFQVDEFLVMNAMQNTAVEGATASNAFIGSKDMLIAYTPSTPSLMTPSAAYNFAWTGYDNTMGLGVSTWYENARKADIVEVEYAAVQKVVSSASGYFLNNVIA